MLGYSVKEHVDNMNGGEEDRKITMAPKAQIEDTREIVHKFLEQQLKITNARERIEFERLQRLGKPKSGSSRPIISRFLRYGDKELVMD